MSPYKRKFKDKSLRLCGWNYANDGYYFITFNTQNRARCLGEIVDGKMILSDWGEIVKAEWLKSFEIRAELFLDEYVIMPDHMHAIVVIRQLVPIENKRYEKSEFYREPKSISSFMAGFKSAVNTAIDNYIDEHQLNIPKYNRNNHFFQSNYYDHIIRQDGSYERIKKYIINNPKKWKHR